jgi:hypothetical protein
MSESPNRYTDGVMEPQILFAQFTVGRKRPIFKVREEEDQKLVKERILPS